MPNIFLFHKRNRSLLLSSFFKELYCKTIQLQIVITEMYYKKIYIKTLLQSIYK